ncbi:MAG: ribosome biogenesis GTP-binding protein YihA/YsxC [Gammaproteobacteria bacterium]
MNFTHACFLISSAEINRMPADTGHEVAFAGRSNAGKSSALNRLTHQTSLARTSATPGRTQLVNFFALDDAASLRLVDLPGYGFARAPRAAQAKWAELVEHYLAERASLAGLVLLADSRHALKPGDETMITWAEASKLPLLLLLTKADKLKRGAQGKALATIRTSLPANAEALIFSARTGLGLDAARAWIAGRFEPRTQR